MQNAEDPISGPIIKLMNEDDKEGKGGSLPLNSDLTVRKIPNNIVE